MLIQLDLCSGIGAGFPNAATQLGGFNFIGVCETDEWCSSILKLRFPAAHNYGDVQTLDTSGLAMERLSRDGIITASPPCPPFSIEGKRQGADDSRDCFPAVTHTIASLQPRFFAIENVTGLLNCPYKPGASHSYFRYILGYLSKFGFDCEWTYVSSGHFSAPFRRERVLLVGVGALSSDASRAPGLTKLESSLKLHGLLKKGEVLNPDFLSSSFNLPKNYLDPSECRTAAQLLEDNARQQEIFLTPELPPLHSSESSISIPSEKRRKRSPNLKPASGSISACTTIKKGKPYTSYQYSYDVRDDTSKRGWRTAKVGVPKFKRQAIANLINQGKPISEILEVLKS
jgi:site-specific DNA-cytosine methylase